MVCEGFPRRKPVMFWLCWKIFDPNWVLNLKDQSLLVPLHPRIGTVSLVVRTAIGPRKAGEILNV